MKHFTTKVRVTIGLAAGAEIASIDMAKCSPCLIRQCSCIAFDDLPKPFLWADVIPLRHPGGLPITFLWLPSLLR
jgi:hypothetical protein